MRSRFQADVQDTGTDLYCIRDLYSGRIVKAGLDLDGVERHLAQMNKDHDDVVKVVEEMMVLLNRSYSADNFVTAMACQHRTLQQGFMKWLVAWIDHLAALPEGRYDLRNSDSVELAKAIAATPQWDRLKYLRLI